MIKLRIYCCSLVLTNNPDAILQAPVRILFLVGKHYDLFLYLSTHMNNQTTLHSSLSLFKLFSYVMMGAIELWRVYTFHFYVCAKSDIE